MTNGVLVATLYLGSVKNYSISRREYTPHPCSLKRQFWYFLFLAVPVKFLINPRLSSDKKPTNTNYYLKKKMQPILPNTLSR